MKYIIQIFLVLFLIYNFVSCDNGKKIKDNITFSNENMVFNNTKKQTIDTMILVGLDELKIKNVIVSVHSFKEPLLNDGYIVKAYIEEISDNYYRIYIDDYLPKNQILTILSHELIHLKQFNKNILILNGENIKWHGITYTPSEYNAVEYNERPWEDEAYSNQYDLSKKISNKLYVSE